MSNLAIHGGESVRNDFLPPFRPTIGNEEINEVIDTLNSDWITTGPKTHKFEALFKKYIGSKHAIAVSSCTAGLHLSLVATGVKEGDEVITSPFTFASTANVIMHQKAKPIFVDIDKDTYNIDPKKIEEKITNKTKAVIPVHYAGHPCEMDNVLKIAKEYNLITIEDAAHALGAIYKSRRVGTISDFTSFSFYATKNITTAEGGMITTDNSELGERIRILSAHGISRDAWKRYSSEGSWYYEIMYPGYKNNMTDIQAAIGLHQVKKLEGMQKRREEIVKKYNEEFEKIPEITPPTIRNCVRHAWHLYPIQLNTDVLRIDRNKFIEALNAENIGTSVHFIPIHLHPYYRKRFGFKRGDFPIAESTYDRIISLPLHPKMNDEDVKDVVVAVNKIVNHYKK